MGVTLLLISLLGLIFLKGFKEAIGVSTILVYSYLALNVVLLWVVGGYLLAHGVAIDDWWSRLLVQRGSIWNMLAVSAFLFPKLALGLSGFETGVAVAPLVKGYPTDTEEVPTGRIRNTKWLLRTQPS